MKNLKPIISWSNKGRKQLTVVYDKKTKKFICGYSHFYPKLVFPKKHQCSGDTPIEAMMALDKFLEEKGHTVPVKNIDV